MTERDTICLDVWLYMLQMFPIVRSAKLVSSSTLALDTHFPWLLVSTSVYELWIDKMISSSRFIRLHLQLYQWKGNDPFYGNPLIGTVLQSSHYRTHPLSKLANGQCHMQPKNMFCAKSIVLPSCVPALANEYVVLHGDAGRPPHIFGACGKGFRGVPILQILPFVCLCVCV